MATKTNVPSLDFAVELVQAGAKAAMAEAGAKSRDLHMVPIGNIVEVADFNVRIRDPEYQEHFDEIKESIKSNGFFQHMPLKGYAGKEGDITFIYCTGGFTRLNAAKAAIKEGAPIEMLPVVLVPPGTNMIDLMVGLDTDNTSNRLRPYERGIVLKRAMNFGAELEDVRKRMGITKIYADKLMYMMGLPNQLQQQVITGHASADTVINLAKEHGTKEALTILETAGEDGEKVTPKKAAVVAEKASVANGKGEDDGETNKAKPIPYKQLMAAINYAIVLPTGLDFLERFIKGDKDAKKELRTHLNPPKARSKTKGKTNGEKDPFDIEPKKRAQPPQLRKTRKPAAEERDEL